MLTKETILAFLRGDLTGDDIAAMSAHERNQLRTAGTMQNEALDAENEQGKFALDEQIVDSWERLQLAGGRLDDMEQDYDGPV